MCKPYAANVDVVLSTDTSSYLTFGFKNTETDEIDLFTRDRELLEKETSILKKSCYMQKKVSSSANNLPSESDEKDSDDDSEMSFDYGVNYNDAAYNTDDEEQIKDGQADTYYCNIILDHLHDEDGERILPTQRFNQGMHDLVQILLSYDDKTTLMPASSTGHKPPIRQLEDVPTKDFNVGQYLHMANTWNLHV